MKISALAFAAVALFASAPVAVASEARALGPHDWYMGETTETLNVHYDATSAAYLANFIGDDGSGAARVVVDVVSASSIADCVHGDLWNCNQDDNCFRVYDAEWNTGGAWGMYTDDGLTEISQDGPDTWAYNMVLDDLPLVLRSTNGDMTTVSMCMRVGLFRGFDIMNFRENFIVATYDLSADFAGPADFASEALIPATSDFAHQYAVDVSFCNNNNVINQGEVVCFAVCPAAAPVAPFQTPARVVGFISDIVVSPLEGAWGDLPPAAYHYYTDGSDSEILTTYDDGSLYDVAYTNCAVVEFLMMDYFFKSDDIPESAVIPALLEAYGSVTVEVNRRNRRMLQEDVAPASAEFKADTIIMRGSSKNSGSSALGLGIAGVAAAGAALIL